jgi:predicted transcriptional regulator
MRGEKTTTIRISRRTQSRVDALARAMKRSRTWVINQALRQYLDYNESFVKAVRDGIKDVKAGRLIDHGDVVKKWERKRTDHKKSLLAIVRKLKPLREDFPEITDSPSEDVDL